jgi:PIN domain nuclease of toxin-antitoxin system
MMRLLIDTHVLIAVVQDQVEAMDRPIREALSTPGAYLYASVASLWEIAIKVRIGKLPLRGPLSQLPRLAEASRLTVLTIEAAHVLADLNPLPATRDPFDRLLLAQCQVENLRLVTSDGALVRHPLAWQKA